MLYSPRHLVRYARAIGRRVSRRAYSPFVDMRRRSATALGAVLLGLFALVFAWSADHVQNLFMRLVAHWPYAPVMVTPIIFAGVAWITARHVPDARGSGIPQVIAAGQAPDAQRNRPLVSMKTALTKFVLTLFMLFSGGSVGREGPTVQISAAIMVAVHRVLRVDLTPGVLIAGGAAGVAAAFNTPLAGIAFAIEELAIAYEQRIAVLVMGAVMIAGVVSLGVAGDYVYFGAVRDSLPLTSVLIIAPVAGIGGGLLGGLFSRLVLAMVNGKSRFMDMVRAKPVRFAALCGLTVALLGIATGGSSWGTGYEPTRFLLEGGETSLWFGPAKFLATLATTASGTPGGIFAPSLSVGAGFGNFLTPLFPDSPSGAVILLGMVAYFVGVVRAPLTAVIILSEATANHHVILPLFATALIADFVSAGVCPTRLYHGLARPFLRRMDVSKETEKPV